MIQSCMPFPLPVYNCIYDFALFSGCFTEINAGSFNAFMSHKISQERYIIAAFQETFCESVPE